MRSQMKGDMEEDFSESSSESEEEEESQDRRQVRELYIRTVIRYEKNLSGRPQFTQCSPFQAVTGNIYSLWYLLLPFKIAWNSLKFNL